MRKVLTVTGPLTDCIFTDKLRFLYYSIGTKEKEVGRVYEEDSDIAVGNFYTLRM